MKIVYRTLSINQLWDKKEQVDFNRKELIQREGFDKLKRGLATNKVEVLYGPRQSGKTVLLMFLIDHLNNSGVSEKNIWYVNLDLTSDYTIFEKPENFIYLYDKSQVKGKVYLFIDEIQRLERPGLFLKAIYDSNRNIKAFVSGSASFEIKAKVKEFLTGRKRLHLVLPLSFREIVAAGGVIPEELWKQKINAADLSAWQRADEIYRKYLVEELAASLLYGYYPGVHTLDDPTAKLDELDEIYNSYLKRDVIDFFRVERPDVFNSLVKVLASQIGNLVNVSELCGLLSGSRATIERYLDILKETFVTFLVSPLTSSKRSEVKLASKIYFTDLGLRNFVIKNLSPLAARTDTGSMFENMVFAEMQKSLQLLDEIHYWRTKSKAEMDFVYSRGDRLIPIEVKTGSAKIGTLTRSFHSFINSYHPQKAVFLNRDQFGHIRANQTDVYYIPLHWFLLSGIDMIA